MIPSVYVAGASKELERCQHWIVELEKTGIRVTYDWTRAVEKFGSQGPELSMSEKAFYARADLRGIDQAHLVWLLSPPPEATSVGMWIEFGYALNASSLRKILISPPASGRCIFAALSPRVIEFATDDEAFAYVQQYSG